MIKAPPVFELEGFYKIILYEEVWIMENSKLQELFNELSIEEKIGQLFQATGAVYEEEAVISGPVKELGINERDIYLAGSVLGTMGAKKTKQIQKKYMEKHPHHIPLLFMLDIINGYKTVYQIPLGQGAAFEPELARKCASMAAREAAADGLHVTFSPMADLVRDARWGRVMEATGEDVYLNSVYARAMVEGYQGEDLSDKETLAACVKHFAGYGAAEAGRDYNTVELSERTLRDFYLPAYESGIQAGAELVMTSFNTIDGIPATINKKLMRDVLRKEMGFDGVLISDFGAIGETIIHGVSEDRADAARRALEAGVDIDMMSGVYPKTLCQLLDEKKIELERIEECAWRVLKLKNKLGLFENPYKGADEGVAEEQILCQEHKELAETMATKSFVLLENKNNILPLSKGKKVLFAGPYVNRQEMLGAWSFTGDISDTITIQQAAEKKMENYEVCFCQGCPILPKEMKLDGFVNYKEEEFTEKEIEKMLTEAESKAEQADVVVLALGEHFLQSGEATSRAMIEIPENQMKLMERIEKINPNIVVVLFNGRPLDIRKIKQRAKAILEVWMPGTMGGNAIVDMLVGNNAPSGKLPMSFPYCVGQIPVHYDELNTGRVHVPGRDKDRYVSKYLDIENKPLYAFGYGLTYTDFHISEPVLNKNTMRKGEKIVASVKVKNCGERSGAETIQLYIHDVAASVARPKKQLKGFQKIELQPQEEQEVSFAISEEMLRFTREDGVFASEEGEFEVFIGNSSEEERKTKFVLKDA